MGVKLIRRTLHTDTRGNLWVTEWYRHREAGIVVRRTRLA